MTRILTLLRDRSGVSALEISLMFPFLMILFFGCVEMTQMVRVYMGLGVATEAMADLLSHGDPDTAAQILDACNGGKMVMAPFSGTSFKAAVTDVKNTAGAIAVAWSDTSCGGATAITGAVAIATPLVPNDGDEAYIVQTAYTYNAATSYVMGPSYTYSYQTVTRPRLPPS